MSNEHSKGTALVTGASTGIGATYAKRLAKRGYDLVLVARNKSRLEALAASLTAETGRKVRIVVADLTDTQDLAKVEALARDDASISLLVNNAGTATLGPLATADIERLNDEIQLNLVAPTRLTRAVLPGLLARNNGAIINISSVMSQMIQPGNSVYGATKSFLLHQSEALAQEVASSNVRIQAVLPGATRTEIWNGAGVTLDQLPPEIVMEVDELVDAALAGFDQGEVVTIPSLPDTADWKRLVETRTALLPNLSRNHAADRYKTTTSV
jgi:short-subunit dehydrogenase